MPSHYVTPPMTMSAFLRFLLIPAALVATPTLADRERDGMVARHAVRDGRVLPLRDIERRVVPQMRGAEYIGFDFDGPSAVYTLKFLRDGSVIWVEVDARSGQVVGQSGR